MSKRTGPDPSGNADKPWGGRFTAATDASVEGFSASVHFDRRLYACDIQGSVAHARMLAQVGVLTAEEAGKIERGLEDILFDIERGEFAWLPELEDVHMNIEARLTDRIGEVGKKLHTGRSRNDQVATDVRLYLRGEIDALRDLLAGLIQALLTLAAAEAETIMPGYTHLQPAQPVTFGHHLLAWVEMLLRDRARLADVRRRVNVMPLGAAALAGTSYPLDRHLSAKLLGFDAVCENSLDAVSDRDFLIEFAAAGSLIMMHLSRFSEELILWSTAQFGFVDIGDAYCTGSSIMPQKKNPDVPELVRGKTGRVYGALTALLTLMKAQPLAYNRDNQEDKEPLFDAIDTLKACLSVYTGMVPHIAVRRDVMRRAALAGYTTATDLADYLVRKGVAFRDAHSIVGQVVRHAIDLGRDLSELSLDDLRRFAPQIASDVFAALTLEGSVGARNHIGGTAPAQVRAAIARARERLLQAGA